MRVLRSRQTALFLFITMGLIFLIGESLRPRFAQQTREAPRKASAPRRAARQPRAAAQQVNADGSITGQIWVGENAVQERTIEIMDRERARAAQRARRRPRERESEREPVQMDRRHLPQNPNALPGAQWPPVEKTDSPLESRLALPTAPLVTPTPSLAFTGATLADTTSFPPDSMGAVGPTQYLVTVNGRIRVFDKKTGEKGALDVDSDVFFDSVRAGQGTSDPRVRYDRLTKRWFIVIINVASSNNRVMLAVSDGPQITAATVWNYFFFVHSQVAPTGDAGCLADYPTLGIDANALYVGANMFCGLPLTFSNTSAFVIRKSSLLGTGPIIVSAFRNLIDGEPLAGGNGIYTPMGVDNYAPTADEGYFIGTDANSYGRLVMRRVLTPGTTPTLSPNLYINVLATSNPFSVRHQGNLNGANGQLDAVDDRLFAAHLRNGSLWTAHSISVDNTGLADGVATRNGSRWYEIRGLGTNAPTLAQAGTVFDATADNGLDSLNYWFPSFMISGQGHALMGFSVAGTKEYVNAGVTMRYASDLPGAMQAPARITNANTPYNPSSDSGNRGGRRRWGDYSYTSLDPCDDMTMWTIQEFCDSLNSYGVRVAKIPAPPPAAPAGANPPSIPAGQASTNVTITGLAINNAGFYDPGAGFDCRLLAAVSGGVTVNNVTYVNPTTVILNVSTVGAAPGLKNVTITNPDGQSATGANLLTVGSCAYNVTSATQSFSASGGAGSINVETTAGCGWTAVSNASFLTINAGATGNGNGAVNFTVAPTQGPARTGTITVAGQTLTITQSAGPGCAYTIAPSAQNFSFNGGTGTIDVTAAPECAWTAISSDPFVNVVLGGAGAGNGRLTYLVAENKGPAARSATIAIGSRTFTVTQEAAPLELAVDDGSFETSTGLANGGDSYRVNRLTPGFYPATLNAVAIFFAVDSGVKVGDPLTILVGANPDGDASIDGTQFQTVSATVQALGRFNIFPVPETILRQGDFVVGMRIIHAVGVAPVALDTTPPSRSRSYRSLDGASFVPIEDLGTVGNYGIRARLVRPDKFMVNAGAQLLTESCAPGNKALDPGETVTVSLSLRNDGARATENLVATLQSTGIVASSNPADGTQTYGALASGGSAVTRNFTFTVSAACGGTLDLTLNLQDGADTLTPVTFRFTVGALAATSQIVSYTGPDVPIPDGSTQGVSIPIKVSGLPSAIGDLNFRIDGTQCTSLENSPTVGVAHTWVGDLVFRLTSPSGRSITIINRAGGSGNSGNNFCQTRLDDEAPASSSINTVTTANAPYIGAYQPSNPLSAFDGENPNGTWTLTVVDSFPGDSGLIRAFSLVFTGFACCPTGCLDVNGLAPNTGAAGTPVTITGAGFQGVTSVRFNDAPASFKINSDTEIVATVPAGATTGAFVLRKPGCVDARTLPFSAYPIAAITPDAPTVPAGQPGTLTIRLTPTQTNSTTLTLTSSSPGVLLAPASVTVPANAATATFQVTGQAPGSAAITAKLPDRLGGGAATKTVTVLPRLLNVVNTAGALGRTALVPIELDSKGDENAVSFSLVYDATLLANPQALPGSDTANALLSGNASQPGQFGLSITLPASQKFSAGLRRIAVVSFDVVALGASPTTTIGFGDQPVARSTLSAAGAPIATQYNAGTMRIGQGFEGDVSPRGAGNGRVTVVDWVQMGRFIAGLEAPTAGNEFQRADSAPRETLGDGKIDLADYVQTGRYVSGLDEPTIAGGPSAPASGVRTPAIASRSLASRAPIARGATAVAVTLSAQGDEQAASFSVEFDPLQWRFVDARIGRDAAGAQLLVNDTQSASGRVGIVLALPSSQRFAAGSREIVTFRFAPVQPAAGKTPTIQLTDGPVPRAVVDRNARFVPTPIEIRARARPAK